MTVYEQKKDKIIEDAKITDQEKNPTDESFIIPTEEEQQEQYTNEQSKEFFDDEEVIEVNFD